MHIRRLIISLIIFLLILVSLFTEEDRGVGILVEKLSDDPVVGKQYLLVIGINDYEHWVPLRHPVSDAKEVRDILKSRYYIDEVLELYDTSATKANILKTFEHLQGELRVEDSLLIFYAGHGHLDTKTDSGFWIPVDAGTDVYAQANWLPNTQIRGSISRMECRHILIISDSCFSGDILNTERSLQQINIDVEYFKKAYARISRQVLTSGAQETVPDKSEFTYQLKMALKGNRSKYLDPLMLFTQLRLGVTKTNPLFGVLAETGHQTEASFLLFLRPQEKEADVLCALTIFAQTSGMLFLDEKEYGKITSGMTRISDLKPGTHTFRIEYATGEAEEQEVELRAGETIDVSFTWIPGIDPGQDKGDDDIKITKEPDITPEVKPKPFLLGFSGAFSTNIGETISAVSPLGGVELAGEWRALNLKPVSISVILGQWYIYHPETGDADYLNNLHILFTSVGCGFDISLGPSVPFTLGVNLLGGLAIGIFDSKGYTDTFVLANPGFGAQLGMKYGISDDLVILGKCQYLTVIGSEDVGKWYHEVSVGIGIGIRF